MDPKYFRTIVAFYAIAVTATGAWWGWGQAGQEAALG